MTSPAGVDHLVRPGVCSSLASALFRFRNIPIPPMSRHTSATRQHLLLPRGIVSWSVRIREAATLFATMHCYGVDGGELTTRNIRGLASGSRPAPPLSLRADLMPPPFPCNHTRAVFPPRTPRSNSLQHRPREPRQEHDAISSKRPSVQNSQPRPISVGVFELSCRSQSELLMSC